MGAGKKNENDSSMEQKKEINFLKKSFFNKNYKAEICVFSHIAQKSHKCQEK